MCLAPEKRWSPGSRHKQRVSKVFLGVVFRGRAQLFIHINVSRGVNDYFRLSD